MLNLHRSASRNAGREGPMVFCSLHRTPISE
jgi:hypothetical protein